MGEVAFGGGAHIILHHLPTTDQLILITNQAFQPTRPPSVGACRGNTNFRTQPSLGSILNNGYEGIKIEKVEFSDFIFQFFFFLTPDS